MIITKIHFFQITSKIFIYMSQIEAMVYYVWLVEKKVILFLILIYILYNNLVTNQYLNLILNYYTR